MPSRISFTPLHLVCLLLMLVLGSLMSVQQATAATTDASQKASAMQQLLDILQNDKQRAELVKALQQTTKENTQAEPATADTSAGSEHQVISGGILGALSSSLDSLQDNFTDSTEGRWQKLWKGAKSDASEVMGKQEGLLSVSTHFSYIIFEWVILSVLLAVLGKHLATRIGKSSWALQHQRMHALASHWVYRALPVIIAFAITFNSRFLINNDNIGSLIGLALSYALSTGVLMASFAISLAFIGNGRHRRRAVTLVYERAYIPLALTLACIALAEALDSHPLDQQLGSSLSHLSAAILGALASIMLSILALRYRRPVGQILYNRSLTLRRRRPAPVARGIYVFSRLWPLPILLMSLSLLYHIAMLSQTNSDVFAQLILSSLLFVVGILCMALVRLQISPNRADDDDDQSRQAIIDRLRGLAALVCTLLVACVFVELICRIWGFSPYEFFSSNYAGRLFGSAVTSTLVVLVVAITCWVIADALIQRTLNPHEHSRYGQPSLRVRTLLPLVRNALKVVLAVVSVITLLANIGINIAPLIASAGMVGLAVSLGAQQLVKDVISGFFNIVENTMSIGDYITVNGITGTVENISIRLLSLRDSNGALNLIPFSQVNQVRNTSRNFGYALIDIRFTLESDIEEMLNLVKQAGEDVSSDSLNRIYLLGSHENYGLTSVTQEGYSVTGRFRTTTAGTSIIQRAFQLALAKRVSASDNVFYSRTYISG